MISNGVIPTVHGQRLSAAGQVCGAVQGPQSVPPQPKQGGRRQGPRPHQPPARPSGHHAARSVPQHHRRPGRTRSRQVPQQPQSADGGEWVAPQFRFAVDEWLM